jgi:hypothetical protein
VVAEEDSDSKTLTPVSLPSCASSGDIVDGRRGLMGQVSLTLGGFGGAGGGFGQPAQQQPQGGGLFGGAPNTQSAFGGGGGGFGATNQASSAFGAPRPTFGATGTSTFGANTSELASQVRVGSTRFTCHHLTITKRASH